MQDLLTRLLLAGGGGFSPFALFAGGVEGAFYDPFDPLTLFSDRAGTTPCGTPGGGSVVPVGLMLDKSQGLVLGSELFVNPNCTDLTGFTAGGGSPPTLVFDNGVKATVTTDDAASRVQTTTITGFVVGKTYLVTVTVNNACTKGNFVASAFTWGTIADTNFALGVSTRTFRVTATATSGVCRYYLGNQLDNDGNVATITQHSIKELAGNHAIAANDTTARPELSARVNLLERSEEFNNVTVWPDLTGASGGNAPVRTANAGVAPDGTLTADRLQLDAAGATSGFRSGVRQTVAIVSGVAYTRLLYLKAYDAGSVGKTVRVHIDGIGSETIVTLTDSWQTVSNSQTSTSTSAIFIVECRGSVTTQTADILVWGADLRPTNIGTAMPAYQRIVDANTYDNVGFPRYLAFNGTSSAMSTPGNVNLSGTDKVTVFAGVRKSSDAAAGVLAELTSSISANNGAVTVFAPDGAAPRYVFSSKGTGQSSASATGYAAPITNVVTGIGDISGDISTLRLNGAQVATSATDQGTGNYSNAPLFIGARNTSSLFLNGNLYSLIVVGSAVSAGSITSTEQWVAQRTGIAI